MLMLIWPCSSAMAACCFKIETQWSWNLIKLQKFLAVDERCKVWFSLECVPPTPHVCVCVRVEFLVFSYVRLYLIFFKADSLTEPEVNHIPVDWLASEPLGFACLCLYLLVLLKLQMHATVPDILPGCWGSEFTHWAISTPPRNYFWQHTHEDLTLDSVK